jgi:hypothetical protein
MGIGASKSEDPEYKPHARFASFISQVKDGLSEITVEAFTEHLSEDLRLLGPPIFEGITGGQLPVTVMAFDQGLAHLEKSPTGIPLGPSSLHACFSSDLVLEPGCDFHKFFPRMGLRIARRVLSYISDNTQTVHTSADPSPKSHLISAVECEILDLLIPEVFDSTSSDLRSPHNLL